MIARYRAQLGIDEARQGVGLDDWIADIMTIIPVNFKSEHKAMLGHCKMVMEHDGGRIAINLEKFDKLVTPLKTAVDNDGVLDKEAISYNDIFDAFRLALKYYCFEERID